MHRHIVLCMFVYVYVVLGTHIYAGNSTVTRSLLPPPPPSHACVYGACIARAYVLCMYTIYCMLYEYVVYVTAWSSNACTACARTHTLCGARRCVCCVWCWTKRDFTRAILVTHARAQTFAQHITSHHITRTAKPCAQFILNTEFGTCTCVCVCVLMNYRLIFSKLNNNESVSS